MKFSLQYAQLILPVFACLPIYLAEPWMVCCRVSICR